MEIAVELNRAGNAVAARGILRGVEALNRSAKADLHADRLVGFYQRRGNHVHIGKRGCPRRDHFHHRKLVSGDHILRGHAVLNREHVIKEPLL